MSDRTTKQKSNSFTQKRLNALHLLGLIYVHRTRGEEASNYLDQENEEGSDDLQREKEDRFFKDFPCRPTIKLELERAWHSGYAWIAVREPLPEVVRKLQIPDPASVLHAFRTGATPFTWPSECEERLLRDLMSSRPRWPNEKASNYGKRRRNVHTPAKDQIDILIFSLLMQQPETSIPFQYIQDMYWNEYESHLISEQA